MTLPLAAATKLASFQQNVTDLQALAEAARRRADELEKPVTVLRNNVRHTASEDMPHRTVLERLEQAEAELTTARTLVQSRFEAQRTAQALCTRLQYWADEQHRLGVELEAVPSTVQIEGGHREHVARLRQQIQTLRAELQSISTGKASLVDAKAQARQLVEQMAERGRPSISCDAGKFEVRGWSPTNLTGPWRPNQVVELLAWYDPDRLIAALDAELEALSLPENGVSAEQRPALLQRIEDGIMTLELQEEAVIEAAARAGVQIERRHDASPDAVLGVRAAVAVGRRAA